jgi:hypothetical protein
MGDACCPSLADHSQLKDVSCRLDYHGEYNAADAEGGKVSGISRFVSGSGRNWNGVFYKTKELLSCENHVKMERSHLTFCTWPLIL